MKKRDGCDEWYLETSVHIIGLEIFDHYKICTHYNSLYIFSVRCSIYWPIYPNWMIALRLIGVFSQT